jgi:hypothetical protein
VSVSNWIDAIRDWRLAVAFQISEAYRDGSLSVPSAQQVKYEAVAEIRRATCLSAATVAGMILMGYGWLWHRSPKRAARRIAEGRCIRCAYDLTGNISGKCPECGTTVKI